MSSVVDDGSELGSAVHGTYKAAIDLVCDAVDAYHRNTGQSKEMSDVFLFELAKAVEMEPEGRAAKFLDHFIFGNGEPIAFDCAQLVKDDAGVRRRITSQIRSRLLADAHLCHRNISGGDFLVAIRQKDYEVGDWKNALGSFPLEWEVVDALECSVAGPLCVSTRGTDWLDPGTTALTRHRAPNPLGNLMFAMPKRVKVYGANEYKWHPAAKRVTQCIHQAGDRLTRSKIRSMNFWMVARPCVIDLGTGMPAA